jgi:hypothetical protein
VDITDQGSFHNQPPFRRYQTARAALQRRSGTQNQTA